MKYLDSLSDAILNRTPEELIGALLMAGAVAIVVAGVYAMGRRKSSPSPTYVGSLVLAAGASCMIMVAGYIEYTEQNRHSGHATHEHAPTGPAHDPGWFTAQRPWSFYGAGRSSGFHVVIAADENRDGRLTPKEVSRLVEKADTDGDGSVNFHDIDRLIASRFHPPFQPPGLSTRASDREEHKGPPDNDPAARSADEVDPLRNLEK